MAVKDSVFRFRHTTKKSPAQTAGEIQALLIRLGATNIGSSVEAGEIVSMAFTYMHDGTEVSFRLPVRWKPILERLIADADKKRRRRPLGKHQREKMLQTQEAQAKRTAWRIALEWLRVQVAFVDTGARSVLEVFMADMITPGRDETLGQYVLERGIQALLPVPSEEA